MSPNLLHDRNSNFNAGIETMISGYSEELQSGERIYKNANITKVRSLCKFQRKGILGTNFAHKSLMIHL